MDKIWRNYDYWTTIDDFEGAWCPCVGTTKKLPNIIMNIWFRQSGKTSNLIKLAKDYTTRYPEKNICILSLDDIHIMKNIKDFYSKERITIRSPRSNLRGIENADILLIDEFYAFSEKDIDEIVSRWNNIGRKGVIIGWSTLFYNHTEINNSILKFHMPGGTKIAFNYVRYEDVKKESPPTYLSQSELDMEYNLITR